MPYKPTGKPSGRPRKTEPVKAVEATPAKPLTRAREGFRRAFTPVADGLYHPPRFSKREVGKKPILHPNVIKG